MLSKALAAAAKAVEPVYVEDVFSTWLYTGNGSTQTITNGIDLSGKGGLVWIKQRDQVSFHYLTDTARGNTKLLSSNDTGAEFTGTNYVTGFNSSGFSLGANANINSTNSTYASWTFRKAAKFFDVVTYTGNGLAGRQIPHSLGSVPGCIIVKRTDFGEGWQVYHRANTTAPETFYLVLNSTAARTDDNGTRWSFTPPTSTYFGVGDSSTVNNSGGTYVAYLFAHNAGGFGDAGDQSVVSCGSFNNSGSGATVNLGWEPQWLLWKRVSAASDWFLFDTMRGMTSLETLGLYPNLSSAESATALFAPTATGFSFGPGQTGTGDYIYIAIRRGPMKTPTDATKVFSTVRQAGGGAVSTGFPVDTVFNTLPSLNVDKLVRSRLTGGFQQLATSSTAAETTEAGQFNFASNASLIDQYFGSGNQVIYECFRRAPGFFDVVAYTGDGVIGRTVTHNLGVKPDLMIVKNRSAANAWRVYDAFNGATKYMTLNDSSESLASSFFWNNTEPTATTFTLRSNGDTNGSGSTYIAYLFASCPGVSKVGSYTGTGTTQQINCGFTAGARFVLIKRTDSTGDWYVWDSARGIVAGNDPYLLLNSTAAEVTNTDFVDTFSTGFEISSTAPAAINANGGSFIFLAVA